MKIHRSIIVSLITIFSGSLLIAQDEPTYADMMPVTFDDRPAADYLFRDFGPEPAEGEPPNTMVVADPDDASNMVARTNRPANAATWSGVTFMTGPGTLPGLNSGSELKMSVRVRAPFAGIPVLLKAESSTGGGDPPTFFMEKLAHTTKADEWEILTFDFADPTGRNFNADFDPFLDRLVLFFNFGAANAPPQTYYFDDVKFGAPEVLNLPFDFESDSLEYGFENFEGGNAMIIDNPQMNDANPSAKVVQMVNNSNPGVTWAGTTVETAGPIAFSIHTRIAMDVFSPAAGKTVLFKLETSNGEAEVGVMTTMANAWETLVFDFTEILATGAEYTNFSLFFGFGETGDGSADHTYLFDNIRAAPAPVVPAGLPLTFEDDTLSYDFLNFDGGVAERIENPDASGINTSSYVGRMVKNAGQTWGGAWIRISSDGLDLSTSTVFKMKVWSPRVGVPVLFKLEHESDQNTSIEYAATTNVINEWEELTFDFTGQEIPDGLTKLVLIFENGTMGEGGADWTFYFDDVYLEGMGIPLNPVDLPVTFDQDNVDYTFIVFGDAMGTTEIVEDPTDASNMVARTVRTTAAPTWAGTTIGSGTDAVLASAIPFANTATQISARVYAPAAGIPIRLKVEDKTNPGISVETEAVTTMANAWETLVFDFGEPAEGAALDLANTYDKMSIFPNFGTDGATAGEQTFYFDDFIFTGMGNLGGPMKIDLPITFQGDPAEIDYTLTDFEGAVTLLGADPMDPTNVVAMTQKGPGAQPWAGTTTSTPSGLNSPIPFTAANTMISVRVYSPAAGMPILLKVEELGRTDNFGMEVIRNTTMANAWETLVFDYSEAVDNTAAGGFSTTLDLSATYQKISIFFNFGVSGNDGGDLIFFWDDVEFVSSEPMMIDLPISFDDGSVDYTLTDFEGASTMLGGDPLNSSNMVAITQKGPGAQPWAGTTISTPDGLNSSVPFTATDTRISVRVYSPAAGMTVRLKVEILDSGNVGLEVDRQTTVANAWETLVFDFTESVAGQFSAPLDLSADYRKISIFFNFGVSGNDGGELTFYWDDVEFVTGLYLGKFINISTRGLVGTGEQVMIGSFVIRDDGQQVLVQAIGPELSNPPSNIFNALADPVLTLRNAGTGEILAQNDNWEENRQDIVDIWARYGLMPNVADGSMSSAILTVLPPGSYSAIVEGKGGTTGVALVEVYETD